jgi:hypothetical protein
MAGNRQEFANQAAAGTVERLQELMADASEEYRQAERYNDYEGSINALSNYTRAKVELDVLTGANQPQQQGQLTPAQQNFIARRVRGGDDLESPRRQRDYAMAHNFAVRGGLQVDSPEYYAACERYLDHAGDGRQKPLSESDVARMCGLTDDEYRVQAEKLQQLKREGHYRE